MKPETIAILIFMIIAFIIIILYFKNSKKTLNTIKPIKSENEITISTKNFLNIGFLFGMGAMISEIILFLIIMIFLKLFQ